MAVDEVEIVVVIGCGLPATLRAILNWLNTQPLAAGCGVQLRGEASLLSGFSVHVHVLPLHA